MRNEQGRQIHGVLADLGQPTWIDDGGVPVYGVLHHYTGQDPARSAVLMVPPFGWDDMCSYRARRSWATALARAGFPTLRIDLPGTGESAGEPTDPGLADSWVGAVSRAAAALRGATGVHRVAAIGIGIGGLVLWRAVCAAAAIDDLVFWAVRQRGRLAVRELIAQSAIIAGRLQDEPPDPPVAGRSTLSGFCMTDETRDWLSAVNIGDSALPAAGSRRALVLGRDAHGVDEGLVESLRGVGLDTSVCESRDFATLMMHPSQGFAPNATTTAVQRWLADCPRVAADTPTLDAKLAAVAEMVTPAGSVTETVMGISIDGIVNAAVLSEPSADVADAGLTAVLLNSGFQRRVGSNRSSVELARRWAAMGVRTLRIDFAGIGDTDGDERELAKDGALYQPRFVPETLCLLEHLRAAGLGDRFVFVGHCSGAYWGLHAAAQDPSVAGVFAIDPWTLAFSEGFYQERMREKIVDTVRGGTIRRIRERGLTRGEVKQVARVLVHQLRGRRQVPDEVRVARDGVSLLRQLCDGGTQVVLLKVRNSRIPQQFALAGVDPAAEGWPGFTLVDLPSNDHQLRSASLQRQLLAELDSALAAVVDREAGRAQLTSAA